MVVDIHHILWHYSNWSRFWWCRVGKGHGSRAEQ